MEEDETDRISDVTVKLLDENNNPINNPLTNSPYEIQTDSDGNYSFENLFPGNYKVEFDIASNYDISPQDECDNDIVDSDIDDEEKTTAIISLNAGTNSENNDAGIKRKSSGGGYNCKVPIIGILEEVEDGYEIKLTMVLNLHNIFNNTPYANTVVKLGDKILNDTQYSFTKDHNGYHLIKIPNVDKSETLDITINNNVRSDKSCTANQSFEIVVKENEELVDEEVDTEETENDNNETVEEEKSDKEEIEEPTKEELKKEVKEIKHDYFTLKRNVDMLDFMIVIPKSGNIVSDILAHAYGAWSILDGVSRNHPYYEAALSLKYGNIMTGRDGVMALDQPIIRVEAAKLLLMGSQATLDKNLNNGPKLFSDVTDGSWYEIYVNYMLDKGIMKGYPNKGIFGTKDNLTYGQMAKLIIKTFNLSNVGDSTSGHWATDYVNVIIDKDLLPKGLDGETNYERVLTRGEFADFIYRTLILVDNKNNRYIDKISISIPKLNIKVPAGRTQLIHPSVWLTDLTESGAAFYYDSMRNRTILFAHSSIWSFDTNPYGAVFKPLIGGSLKEGDSFEITREGKTKTYEVLSNILVDESEVGYLKNNEFIPKETDFILFTCDKDISDRWIYYAKELN